MRCTSKFFLKADLRQRAARYPVLKDSFRPRAARAVAMGEVVDEVDEDAVTLCRIGDDHGHRR